MKPTDYLEYSKIFDLFSDSNYFPAPTEFINILIQAIGDKPLKVCDIGAGTGLFSKKLYDACPNIELNLIEPSPDMNKLLTKRFLPLIQQNHPIHIHQLTCDQALKLLPHQDMFIFQRSLYAFSGNINDYYNLSDRLYQKINNEGIIAIFEIYEKMNISQMKKNIYNKSKYVLPKQMNTTQNIDQYWQQLKKSLITFNNNIDNNQFTLFSAALLETIFKKNFITILQKNTFSFYIKK
jgi:ubiquinone/menaquinone biosynthesis C-methylase UbiE